MPPMPVAAPSTGMTWLGWLWLSWAMTMPQRRPSCSPKSMMPGVLHRPEDDVAAASVGRCSLRCGRLLLYEQCSLHMVSKRVSSVSVGVATEQLGHAPRLVRR